jgi:hypothetical protein
MRRVDLSDTTRVPIRRHEGGYAAEGPGFYVWDENLDEVIRAARQLERGELQITPTRRLLVVPEGP